MEPQLVAFDLDGTLADSRAAILGCFRQAQQDNGLVPVDDWRIAARIGLPLAEMLDGLLAPEAIERCLASYRSHYPAWDRRHTTLFPGVIDLLHALRDRGTTLAITSSKSRVGVERVLREQRIEALFAVRLGGDDVSCGKPHPEMVLRAADAAGADLARTVVVGDTTYDVEMGLAAGARTLGVSWGMHEPHRLHAAGAHAVVDRVGELLDAIAG